MRLNICASVFKQVLFMFLFGRPGDIITILDDSNEDWWKVILKNIKYVDTSIYSVFIHKK